MLEIKLDAERLDHGLSTLLKNATDTRAMMRGIPPSKKNSDNKKNGQ